MEFKFNVSGKERKLLAQAVGEIRSVEVKYLGVPSCNYAVGDFTIDKAGTLIVEGGIGNKEIEDLLKALSSRGFTSEENEITESKEDLVDNLVIEMPRELFTEVALTNLEKLVESKTTLLKRALNTDCLTIEQTEETIRFPWFNGTLESESVKAYTHLVTALCEMARTQKRINAKEKETENDKYAFRCFLLRLGFIGSEFKEERRILLKNLTGSSAFKGGVESEISE